jgi:polysaccharide chain length determinant protein (PEP-CTERM system associated)
MAEETAKAVQLDKILAVWRRRKWLAICSFVGVLSATAAFTTFLPNIYQAGATILVVGQQVPAEFVRTTVTGTLDTRLQTISQQILSRSRLEELIKRFGLYSKSATKLTPEVLVERMRRDIDVKPTGVDRAGGTVAFTIKYQGRDPGTVALVSNTLASYYIEENVKVRERQATGTAEFLRTQLEQVKKRLEVQERQVSDFKRRNLGELPTQMDANLSTLERLNTQFRLNGERQIRARDQRQEITRQLEAAAARVAPPAPRVRSAPTQPDDPAVARLERLRQTMEELRGQFSERYPDVVRLKAEIAKLESQLNAVSRRRPPAESASVEPEPDAPIVDPHVTQMQQALNQLNLEIKALVDEEAHLRTVMGTYQTRVDNTPRRDLEYQELSRDYDSTKELYRTLLKRYEEAQLSESLEQRQKGEQFRILEPAELPTEPVTPNRRRFLALAVALSLAVAVGLVVLAEQLDTSFHTIDDLRALTPVPVLVSIPRIVTENDVHRRRWRAQLTTAAAVLAVLLIVGGSYLIAHENEQLLRLLTPGRS